MLQGEIPSPAAVATIGFASPTGLVVRSAGRLGQSADLCFRAPVKLRAIALDGRALTEGSDWSWKDRTGFGVVDYACPAEPLTVTIGL